MMPKEKSSAKKGGSKTVGSNSRNGITIQPDIVYFTHSRVRPQFTGCNKVIADTIAEIVSGQTRIEDIPMITVIENEGNYFSLNNRRLFMFKELSKLGLLPAEGIQCLIKPALEREKQRYLPSRCSLKAKLMGGKSKDPSQQDGKEAADEGAEGEESDEEKEESS